MAVAIAKARGDESAAEACDADREIRRVRTDLNLDLLAALERVTAANPVFRVSAIGTPGSEARIRQEEQIAAEDQALQAIAAARGLCGLAVFPLPGRKSAGHRVVGGDGEPDYGGTVGADGNVYSDADPGL